jgi:hypothetical protein
MSNLPELTHKATVTHMVIIETVGRSGFLYANPMCRPSVKIQLQLPKVWQSRTQNSGKKAPLFKCSLSLKRVMRASIFSAVSCRAIPSERNSSITSGGPHCGRCSSHHTRANWQKMSLQISGAMRNRIKGSLFPDKEETENRHAKCHGIVLVLLWSTSHSRRPSANRSSPSLSVRVPHTSNHMPTLLGHSPTKLVATSAQSPCFPTPKHRNKYSELT